ncbi:conserved hypothetical protein [Gammaproteobacteria bacterium]
MQTLTFECEINDAHDLVLRLPPSVSPGRHRISLVIDPTEPIATAETITPIPENVPPRTPLWSRLTFIRQQAEKTGALPEPLSWDGVLAEVQLRRGERDD